jgi:hypothetical protein
MADNFVDTPMSAVFNKNGEIPSGGAGTYDGDDCPGFRDYRRTKSPNGVPEKIIDGKVGDVSGESDQFGPRTSVGYDKTR